MCHLKTFIFGNLHRSMSMFISLCFMCPPLLSLIPLLFLKVPFIKYKRATRQKLLTPAVLGGLLSLVKPIIIIKKKKKKRMGAARLCLRGSSVSFPVLSLIVFQGNTRNWSPVLHCSSQMNQFFNWPCSHHQRPEGVKKPKQTLVIRPVQFAETHG